jgi:hypothetical protein
MAVVAVPPTISASNSRRRPNQPAAPKATGPTDEELIRKLVADSIDGNAVSPFEQELTLRRGPGGWTVESIGR